jgi:hypothetical protein
MDLKISCGGSQDCSLDPYDKVVKAGEGWVDLELVLLAGLPNEYTSWILQALYYVWLLGTQHS